MASMTILPLQHSVIASTNSALIRLDKLRPPQHDAEFKASMVKQEKDLSRRRAQAQSRGPLSRLLGTVHYQLQEVIQARVLFAFFKIVKSVMHLCV